ncbi:hypothetical protein [Chitinimonas lacunae]|uniref:Uncharacterized protein n=1 Tax=Chitinimonas lacunae TaxID=1963018 RepID=A0ABV8MP59_9NEIS
MATLLPTLDETWQVDAQGLFTLIWVASPIVSGSASKPCLFRPSITANPGGMTASTSIWRWRRANRPSR